MTKTAIPDCTCPAAKTVEYACPACFQRGIRGTRDADRCGRCGASASFPCSRYCTRRDEDEGKFRRRIVTGPELFRFDSHDDWVATAARKFRSHEGSGDSVCIDTKGRICRIGAHFKRANDDGAFPVIVYSLD